MVWPLLLLTIFWFGLLISKYLLRKTEPIILFAASFLTGSYVVINYLYFITSYLTHDLALSLNIYFGLSVLFIVWFIGRNKTAIIPGNIKTGLFHPAIIFIFICLVFSWYIFNKTFSYDQAGNNLLIASNVYADFGMHVPVIRSFSLGNNFPFEVPVYAGGKLLYHFMFDFYAGVLEFSGLRIDHSFNLISAFAFTSLLLLIYRISYSLFRNIPVAVIAVLLFIFQSSFSLLPFIANNWRSPLSLLSGFWHNAQYYISGPLGDKTYSVCWSLNAYVNQRHTVFGFAFALLCVYLLASKQVKPHISRYLVLGFAIGLLPFWNTFAFIFVIIMLAAFQILRKGRCRQVLITVAFALVVSVPELLLIGRTSRSSLGLNPGFVISDKFTITSFMTYWVWNLGLTLPLGIMGFIFAKPGQRLYFLAAFPLYALSNLFHFSSDVVSGHKLLSLWIIFLDIYAAFALIHLINSFHKPRGLWLITIVLLFLPGIFNFLVIKNDVLTPIADYQGNRLMTWVKNNLSPDKIILTNGEIYDPVTLSGKKVYLGWVYYIIAYGADPSERSDLRHKILSGTDPEESAALVKNNAIKYLVIYKNNFAKNEIKVNEKIFQKIFRKIYEDRDGAVYEI